MRLCRLVSFVALVGGLAIVVRAEAQSRHFNHILDRLGIETSMANRFAMAGYLDPARFKWVFFVDCFMFPFDNAALVRNPDLAAALYR
jgi:hypothetical protein